MNYLHRALLTLAVFSLPQGVLAQDAPAPERGWSIVREDLQVTIDGGERSLQVSGILQLVLDGKDSSAGPSIGINSRNPLISASVKL